MPSIPDSLQLPIIIVALVSIVCILLFMVNIACEIANKKQLLAWRSRGSTIIVNGTQVNPDDISKLVYSSGNVEIYLKSGQNIESSNWTIITPAPPTPKTPVEKYHE